MIRMLLIGLFIFASQPDATAQPSYPEQDSVVFVTMDAYWKRLLSFHEKVYAIGCGPGSALKFLNQEFSGLGQQIIKTDTGIYVHLAATGIIFKGVKANDSLLKFTRVDDTHNKYYNQGGHLLAQNENIFIFGGYGFWKSNGHLKKFNYRDKEWDIVPISKEIHPPLLPKPGIWHDAKEKTIYLLFTHEINDAIITSAKPLTQKNTTYKLNLKTMKWEEQLSLHPSALELIKNGVYQIPFEKGIYVFKGIDLYLFDIKENRILKMNDRSYSQSFARVLLQDMFYTVNNRLYFKEQKSGKLDSLILPTEKFETEPYPIFRWSIPSYIYWLGILALLIMGSLVAYKKINADESRQSESTSEVPFKGTFSSTELSLISLLVTKCRNKQKADINELNYVLGVKDKNIGLQKKVRSEAIHNINEKFRYIFGSESGLISSDRSNADKRYFEYYISRDLLRWAEEIIKKNK